MVLALAHGFAVSVNAQVMLYRGDYVYVLPTTMSEKMATIAPPDGWKFFDRHTRYVDPDDDGINDFVAIALGARGGYGAQVRYRLKYDDSSAAPLLSRWYWCVITDQRGEKVFEKFNP